MSHTREEVIEEGAKVLHDSIYGKGSWDDYGTWTVDTESEHERFRTITATLLAVFERMSPIRSTARLTRRTGVTDVQGNPIATTDSERCTVALGAPGDDSRRCERLAHPIHNTHLIDGVYQLPSNNVDVLVEGHRECCGWTPDQSDGES